jgi:hypothetical protein
MIAAPDIAFSAVLGLAAIVAALSAARVRGVAGDYLRLAAALYAALSLADVSAAAASGAALALANAVTPIVCALGATALAFALCISLAGRPGNAVAAILLVLAAGAGIAAAATGALALAFAPLFASVCAMLAFSARAARRGRRGVFTGSVAALSLAAGASAYLTGGAQGRTALALFSAAALLGISLSLSREPQARASKPRRAIPRALP